MSSEQGIQLILSGITIVGVAIAIYRSYADPNKKQDEEIAVGNAVCIEKHKAIDDNIANINRCLSLIQENELKHIEARLTALELGQIRIETILNERLPIKK